jgi:hypothetical protein
MPNKVKIWQHKVTKKRVRVVPWWEIPESDTLLECKLSEIDKGPDE